ncbi:MAG TPA: DUF1569 domain-containing protein [Kineosporiaceae bacterium]|nr:DUF1569 domain-containing protein [Kineosporiaceae bacterium]
MGNHSLEDLAGRLRAKTAIDPLPDLLAANSVWNLSQTLQHCAQTIGYSVTGYPKLKPRPYRATVGALAKRIFLRSGAMRHPLGAEIEGAPPLDPGLAVAEAVTLLSDAVRRFSSFQANHAPHPAYGTCTHQEYAALHAMHLVEHLPGLVTS